VRDVGAGAGATLRLVLDLGIREGTYRGVDRSRALVEHASRALPDDLRGEYDVTDHAGGAGGRREGFEVEDFAASFEVGDILELSDGAADLVVGQALVDLVPIEDAMAAIERALRPGGLAYLPITFDGVSVFLPAHHEDGAVVEGYHAAIDDEPGRDSRAGRRLIEHLGERDGELLAVGASDWIVRPRGAGYPANEAYFLGRILDFVEEGLSGRGVDADDWLAERRRQLDSAELSYVAHGYDLLYRAPEA
jgi:SAM-dependent methyltransferase